MGVLELLLFCHQIVDAQKDISKRLLSGFFVVGMAENNFGKLTVEHKSDVLGVGSALEKHFGVLIVAFQFALGLLEANFNVALEGFSNFSGLSFAIVIVDHTIVRGINGGGVLTENEGLGQVKLNLHSLQNHIVALLRGDLGAFDKRSKFLVELFAGINGVSDGGVTALATCFKQIFR